MKSVFSTMLTPFRMILISYLLAMLIFSILLSLPIAHYEGVEVSYKEALFVSVSAVSVTGLTVIDISESFNVVGTIFLSLAIQLGGIGIMTLGTFFWMLLRKRIQLSQRMLIMVDQNQSTLSGLVKLMKGILFTALCIEIVGGFILGTYYLTYFDTALEAYVQGFFASLSAFTNAGFDITGQSLIPFANDYFVQTFVMIWLIAGAIGFPVILEIKEFVRNRKSFRFSLFTKITTFTFAVVFVIGAIGIWLFEFNHLYIGMDWHQQFFTSIFNSATTRSAGLTVVENQDLQPTTLLLMSSLMMIGASPSSVGGGIRTTTLAVIFLTIKSFALGQQEVKAFGRQIHLQDIQKAFIVLSVFLFLLFTSILLIVAFENGKDITLLEIIFEASSAFGTCGLSLGITSELTFASQVVLMVLMYIGRVGLVAFLFSIRKKESKSHYHYPTERIIIG
ncbi:potassium transporter KtrD [Bacillus sp. TS-2]|nr:potassium transporter KtrD [Bacillus sp. TS-2]